MKLNQFATASTLALALTLLGAVPAHALGGGSNVSTQGSDAEPGAGGVDADVAPDCGD